MVTWKPSEIVVHDTVRNDPVTQFFLGQCAGTPVKYVRSGTPNAVVKASDVLTRLEGTMLDKILLGKQVVYIAPATDAVDVFTMPDDRMTCPHFYRLKLASNGCFYRCEWCYLKLTYRAAFPFMTIRVQYQKIKEQLLKKLKAVGHPIMFNSGELADSLSMEHLTRAGREFIPWFGQIQNAYLFMLTKSDNVDAILDLAHNGHTIIAWSLNNEIISQKFEVGAPSFERRLIAARKVQEAGYRLRIRLDPIVPFSGWEEQYARTVYEIFKRIFPETVTLGTLRFEEGFYRMRNTLFSKGTEATQYLDGMEPMFPSKVFPGSKRPKSGKYSFTEAKRIEIFDFVINEIHKFSDCPVALCKESANVWNRLGLPVSECRCVCQLDSVDMSAKMHSGAGFAS